MFCYTCDPNWEQWLTQNSDGTFQLQLNNQVCQSLSGQCFGYLESMQKQYETAVEVQKLNNFLDHDDQIRAYIAEYDYGSLENLYAQHQTLTELEYSTILEEYAEFQIPDSCTEKECPYICEEFITPNGINAEEILTTKNLAVSLTSENDQEGGFLDMIEDELKVMYSQSENTIIPENVSTRFDTSTSTPEELQVVLTTDEKELLTTTQVEEEVMMDEHSIYTALEDVEKDTLIELDTMEFVKGSIFEESSSLITKFVLSGACLLYLIMFALY